MTESTPEHQKLLQRFKKKPSRNPKSCVKESVRFESVPVSFSRSISRFEMSGVSREKRQLDDVVQQK